MFFRQLFLFCVAAALLQAKLIYLSHEKIDDQLFVNQTIAVTYNAIITDSNIASIDTEFVDADGIRQVSYTPKWQKVDENRYKLTVYFKITAQNIIFPKLNVWVTLRDGNSDFAEFQIASKRARDVATNSLFSKVLANSLDIITHKVERFNDDQNILVLEMQANMSNLAEFHLNGIDKENQGTDWIDNKLPTTKIFYYAIIPNVQTNIAFNYFVPTSGDFKRISLEFDLSSLGQQISTHSDINPKKRSIPWLDILLLAMLGAVLILLFFKTNRYFFLALVFVAALLIFWLIFKEESALIKANAEIRLLPTTTSTLFYETTIPTRATILKEKNGYIKVLLPDEKIGWVKKEEVLNY